MSRPGDFSSPSWTKSIYTNFAGAIIEALKPKDPMDPHRLMELARTIFAAGVDYGIDYADAHDPDHGHASPSDSERATMFDSWLRGILGDSENEPTDPTEREESPDQ